MLLSHKAFDQSYSYQNWTFKEGSGMIYGSYVQLLD